MQDPESTKNDEHLRLVQHLSAAEELACQAEGAPECDRFRCLSRLMRVREHIPWSVVAVSDRLRWRRLVSTDMLCKPLHIQRAVLKVAP